MRNKIIPYNSELKILAKKLRNNMTFSEVLLWNEIKARKMKGYDFDRQRPIDNYIVDFYCKKLMLVIEVDGYSHYSEEAYSKDLIRQKKIESFGVTFLRFDDSEVKNDMNNVLCTIELWIEEWERVHTDPPLAPPRRGTAENSGSSL